MLTFRKIVVEKATPKNLVDRVINFLYLVDGKLYRLLVNYLSDEQFLAWKVRHKLGYKMDFKNPQTFNAKLQWLKLYYRKPEFTSMVDKVTSKDYVSSIIGEKYIIKTLGVWDNIEDIDWDSLPNQFVVKSTNDSGGVVVCKDKSKFDKKAAIAKLSSLGARNYIKYNKEYPYENVPHRFLAEEYKEDESGFELKDYKMFCFNGEPKMIFVASDRQLGAPKFDFFDLEWNHLDLQQEFPNSSKKIARPKNLEEMIDVARKLSKNFPHIRVDLYNCNGVIYFGELTFFHNSGTFPWYPESWDYKMGEWLTLPSKYEEQ